MPKVSEDHLAARRSQILDGARRCFAEFGYEGATVRRLEEATGLSRGAIFHHFRDKDASVLCPRPQGRANGWPRSPPTRASSRSCATCCREPERVRLAGHPARDRPPAAHRCRVPRAVDGAQRRTDRRHAGPPGAAEGGGTLRDDVPTDVLLGYLDLVLDGLIARIASGQTDDNLSAVLDLVEESVRRRG